jgi:hypothetical protein
MNFLVISRQHGLLPFSNRLKSEGHNLDQVVWKHRYERAWSGRIDKTLRGSKGEIRRDILEGYVKHCESGDAILLTDVPSLTVPFTNAQRRYHVLPSDPPPAANVRLGAWFDGENLQAPHLLVYDLGSWPGGLGSRVPGGATLILPNPGQDLSFLDSLWGPIKERLKSETFRGLVNADIIQSPETGEVSLGNWEAGWPFLQTHAFVAELENFGDLLAGAPPVLSKRFVVVVPVSIPPWPNQDARGRESRLVTGLSEPNMGQFFWHDVEIHRETREIHTAGLDGLIGIARGTADSHFLARLLAVERARQLQVEEKQFRPDVSEGVPAVLALLEQKFGLAL